MKFNKFPELKSEHILWINSNLMDWSRKKIMKKKSWLDKFEAEMVFNINSELLI